MRSFCDEGVCVFMCVGVSFYVCVCVCLPAQVCSLLSALTVPPNEGACHWLRASTLSNSIWRARERERERKERKRLIIVTSWAF